jgi:hypothetical protein
MTWQRGLLGAAVLGMLVGTHWLAFRAGQDSRGDQMRVLSDDVQAGLPVEQLRASVDSLRAAVRSPGSFTGGELGQLRIRAKMLLFDVEKKSIPHAERLGNLDEQRRLQTLVTSARGLLAKLPKQ